jgi:hypothetical protein
MPKQQLRHEDKQQMKQQPLQQQEEECRQSPPKQQMQQVHQPLQQEEPRQSPLHCIIITEQERPKYKPGAPMLSEANVKAAGPNCAKLHAYVMEHNKDKLAFPAKVDQ